jgi:hypothetical protein
MSTADIPRIRKIYELMEHQGWVHHVANVATGKLLTTRLSQPLAPLSRVERLSQVFGTQHHRSRFHADIRQLDPDDHPIRVWSPRRLFLLVDSVTDHFFTAAARADEVMSR